MKILNGSIIIISLMVLCSAHFVQAKPLDYTNGLNTWENQNTWASNLDESLTYNLNPGYSVNWSGDWRLPSTVDGDYELGYDGTTTGGFNITSSEMGYLYYAEFGYSYTAPAQVVSNAFFNNLVGETSGSFYWSATDYLEGSVNAWRFDMWNGDQNALLLDGFHYGLALRTGEVVFSTNAPVPEPATVILFGTGLVCLVGVGRRKKRLI